MFIHFFCLCPLGLATKLNFNISKEAYWSLIINGGFPEIIIACGENVVVPTHFLFLDIRAKEIDINLCLRNI